MDAFDLGGVIRRIRRSADVSQRELAEALGISQTQVAGGESGRRSWSVDVLVRAATLAGLRLALLDEHGAEVLPMATGGARDRAGRRLPAHLDSRPGDVDWWHGDQRYSRPRPEWTYDVHRDTRDRWRTRTGTPQDHDVPGPADTLAARAAARQAAERLRRAHRIAAVARAVAAGEIVLVDPTCHCPEGCDELLLAAPEPGTAVEVLRRRPVHVADCGCRCDIG